MEVVTTIGIIVTRRYDYLYFEYADMNYRNGVLNDEWDRKAANDISF